MADNSEYISVRRIRNAVSLCTADVEAARVSLMAELVKEAHILLRRGMRPVRDSFNKCVAESIS